MESSDPRDRQITIRGKRYTLKFVLLRPTRKGKWCGVTDPPNQKGKGIRIHKTLVGLEMLDTLLHELIHGGLDDLDETVVEQLGTDIGRTLWKLGYRAPWDIST